MGGVEFKPSTDVELIDFTLFLNISNRFFIDIDIKSLFLALLLPRFFVIF